MDQKRNEFHPENLPPNSGDELELVLQNSNQTQERAISLFKGKREEIEKLKREAEGLQSRIEGLRIVLIS